MTESQKNKTNNRSSSSNNRFFWISGNSDMWQWCRTAFMKKLKAD